MVKDCSRIEPGEHPGEFRWMPGYDRAVLLTQDTDFIPLVRTVSGDPFWGTCAGERFPSVGSRCQEYERCHKAASAPGSCARTIAENR
jgi:hypothetical protein